MSDPTSTPAATTSKTEYESVAMEDGRKVDFAGKRQIQKEVIVDEKAGTVSVRFDFRNGSTRSISSSDLTDLTVLQSCGHGLAQKCGDEAAGLKDIDDIVAAVDDMMERLKKGEWRAVSTGAGDSFSGTHVVIKAVAEVTGKSVEAVKAFLQGKLDTAKAAGQALSRQELYASFRKPGTKTAAVIARLEAEKGQKASKVSADDLLAEIG
jgi:hypothetical protein